jgi:glucosyl-dolichyl phosphate glucuronosyltransferase
VPEIVGNDVDVVVCTYQLARWEMLTACLQSLQEQTLRPRRVIVVVDGCAELAEALERRGGPEELVVLERNSGLSAARNAGVNQVKGRWVAFLDDDAVADPCWLERLAEARDATSALAAGGWSVPEFQAGTPRWFPEELLWTVGGSYAGLPTRRAIVRNVFGGCALFSTEVLRRLGGFDVTLGRKGDGSEGGEEAEFCVRAAQQDPTARFVHEPTAVIRHHVPASRARPRYVLGRCLEEGRSKGRVARLRGVRSLTSESSFVAGLPLAAVRHLVSGRPTAALMLLLGVLAAATGYVSAWVSARVRPRPKTPRGLPVTVTASLPGDDRQDHRKDHRSGGHG